MTKVLKFSRDDDGKEAWLEARKGRFTGTRNEPLNKRGGGYKKMFYEIIAERVAIPPDGENVMDRGIRLEDEALTCFEEITGLELNRELRLICRDDYPDISYSPDATVEGEKASVEVKCLNSASFIEAWITREVPSEYESQSMQPFVVNDELERLYFVFYDPRMPMDFFFLTIERKDHEERIKYLLESQISALKEIEAIVDKFTF